MIVPSEAVIFERNGLSAAVVEDGVVHLCNVTSVRDFGATVDVSGGVKDGDRIALNPEVDLTEGHRVAIRYEPSET